MKYEGGLKLLHNVEDDALNWLNNNYDNNYGTRERK